MGDTDKRFSETLVGDVFDLIVKRPTTVIGDSTISDVIEGMLGNPVSRKVYVVDEQEKLLGMVTTDTVLRLIGYRTGVRELGAMSFYRFLRDMFKEKVSSFMAPTLSVTKEDNLKKALDLMLKEHVNDLPVIDAEGRIIGELISLELFLKGRELFVNDGKAQDVVS
ncbi:MAG: CBS domain-containing protein [Methanomassiliicoccus sp.]|nr:CBS domain-containing protein [Methanomassiliicoccus sp.]